MSTGWTTHTNVATTVYAANSKNPKRKESVMNIDIPGLTPEMCQARADMDRKCRYDAEHLRDKARERPLYVAYGYLFRAAILEQYPARPELRVGDLARVPFYGKARVDHIGRQRVFVTHSDGRETSHGIEHITPTGEPAPDDWGRS